MRPTPSSPPAVGLPQPDQQRAGLPLHLPRSAGRAGLTINEAMKIAAAKALAELAREDVPDQVAAAFLGRQVNYGPDYIIPAPFDPRLISHVPPAVAKAAMETRRGAPADRRHGGLRGEALGPARPRRRLAAQHLLPGAACAQAHRLRRGRAAADRARRQRLPQRRSRAGDPDRPRTRRSAKPSHGRRRPHRRHRDARHQSRRATARVRRVPVRRLQRKGYLLRDCQRLVNNDRNVFAACMVAMGHADGMVTGVTRNWTTAYEDVRRVLDARPRRRVIGVSIALARGRAVLVADVSRPRHAQCGTASRHRRGGGRRRAPPRHGAARRVPRLLDLRSPARRALRPRARGRRPSSTSARSTSSTTATWRPTWR